MQTLPARTHHPIATLSALACLTLGTILAQPVAAQEIELDDIVVSATLVPTETRRTGVSITVVTEADLEAAGDQQLSTFLARLPGVGVVQSGPAGTMANLRIRGTDPRYVAVYVDGVRVDDPTSIATEFDFGALGTADIGRVEILRGSQSALYGGSAVGGVINITTRRAQKDGFAQSIAVETGSRRTHSGRYALTFRQDRLETALTLSHLRSRGFSAYDTLPRTPGLAPDGIESTRLSFSARYQATDTLVLGISAFTQRTDSEFDGFLADVNNRSERRETGGRVFAELATGNTDHMFEVTQYRITRNTFGPTGANTGRFEGQRTGFAYQGTTRLSDQLSLVYGADTMAEKSTTAAQPVARSTRVSGVFAQALYAPRSDLDLSASARYDRNSRFGSFTSGRIAAAWRPTEAVTLRGALARGFRAPSIYEQFGDTRFGIGPNAQVGPESSRSFEFGADLALAGGASIGATLFRIDIDNAITYCGAWSAACATPIPGGFTNLYENLPGRSKRQGLELSGEVPLGERLTLGGSYTYTDARRPDGTRASRVPRHNLGLSLDARLTERLDGTLGLHHVGGRPADGFPAIAMPSYTVVNARLALRLDDATALSLRVENLFDKQYQQVQGYGTAGRSFHIGLRRDF